MARVTIPAGTLPVMEDGRLVGLIRPRPDLTQPATTSKVTPMTNDTPFDPAKTVYGRPLTEKEQAEADAYRAAYAKLEADLGRPPTTNDDGYWTLPKFTSGADDPSLVEQYAKEAALVENRTYEAPAQAPSAPAQAPAAPVKAKATPDASGVIYVPGRVCRDCSGRIQRKPGAGRPPAKCLDCRAKDAEAAAARKAASK